MLRQILHHGLALSSRTKILPRPRATPSILLSQRRSFHSPDTLKPPVRGLRRSLLPSHQARNISTPRQQNNRTLWHTRAGKTSLRDYIEMIHYLASIGLTVVTWWKWEQFKTKCKEWREGFDKWKGPFRKPKAKKEEMEALGANAVAQARDAVAKLKHKCKLSTSSLWKGAKEQQQKADTEREGWEDKTKPASKADKEGKNGS